MSDFMGDRPAKQFSVFRAGAGRQPFNTIGEDGRQRSLAGACIDDRIPERKRPVELLMRRVQQPEHDLAACRWRGTASIWRRCPDPITECPVRGDVDLL
jgi:hypothetical protein